MPKFIEFPTLLLGGSGFLGSYFAQNLAKPSVIHISSSYGEQDSDGIVRKFGRFNNETDLLEFLSEFEFKNVINCIALANIEECEKNPNLAKWLNIELPGAIARYCKSIEASMIHISTDAVFDGKTPFRSETESPSPVSNYGRTKLEGENLVLETLPESLIARVNFFGRSEKKDSLFDFFYSRMKSGVGAFAYDDVFFTPTYAAETVRLILELANKSLTGLYHVVGNQRISKYEFAKLISSVFELDSRYITQVQAPSSQMSKLRGHDLSLSNQKLKSIGAFPCSIEDGLRTLKLEMEKINAS
jgi:dTDP-4-dehydrorhamnose reductase